MGVVLSSGTELLLYRDRICPIAGVVRFVLPAETSYNQSWTGRSSVRQERTVRVREVGGSSPPAPTP